MKEHGDNFIISAAMSNAMSATLRFRSEKKVTPEHEIVHIIQCSPQSSSGVRRLIALITMLEAPVRPTSLLFTEKRGVGQHTEEKRGQSRGILNFMFRHIMSDCKSGKSQKYILLRKIETTIMSRPRL